MANQIIIDIGAAANDGTGDPLRTAFNYVNENFTSIWDTGVANSNVSFSGNRILTLNTNGNLVLAPNGTGKVQANVDIIPNSNNTHSLGSPTLRWNTVYAQNLDVGGTTEFNNLTVNGNLTVEGDIIQIGNIVTDSKTIQLANTASTDAAANGSGITVGASDDIATLLYNSDNNVWTTNIGISATGNIQGQYFVGNGSLLTGITSYGNANVAAYLPTYTGNLSSGNLSVSSSGDTWTIAGQTLTAPGGAFWYSNPDQSTDDFVSAPGSNVRIRSIDTDSVLESQLNLTPVDIEIVVVNGVTRTWRFNESGVTEFPGCLTPVVSVGGCANIGNITNPWSNAYISGNISAGNITTTGNITADYFIGDGSQLTNLPFDASKIENGTSNVEIATANGNVTVTANSTQTWTFGTSGNLRFPDGTTYTGSEIDSPTVPTVGGTASAGEAGITYLSGDLSKWAIFSESAFTVGVWTDVQVGWTVTDNNGFTDIIAGRGSFGAASFQTTVNSWPAPASGKTYVFTSPDYQLGYTNPVEITVGNDTWTFGNTRTLTAPGNITTTGNVTAGNLITSGNISMDWLDVGNIGNIAVLAADVKLQITADAGNTAPYWTFNNDGTLYVPGNISGDNTAPLIVEGSGSGEGYISLPNASFGGEQVAIVNKFGLGNGIRLETNGGNIFFDDTGNLTVPGNIIMPPGTSLTGSGASPAPSISGFTSVSAETLSATGNVTGGNLLTSGNLVFSSTQVQSSAYAGGNGHAMMIDTNRTDTYEANGSADKPFKTFAAAIAAVATLNPTGTVPYTFVLMGCSINEDVDFTPYNFNFITISTTCRSVFNNPVTFGNSSLLQLTVRNVEFANTVTITGDGTTNQLNNTSFYNTTFSGALTVTATNALAFYEAAFFSTVTFNNVNYLYVNGAQFNDDWTIRADNSGAYAVPSNGITPGVSVLLDFIANDINFVKGGTGTYVFQPQGSRMGRSAESYTLPAGWTLSAYSSVFRGTWTNNGTWAMRNSSNDNAILGTAPTYNGTIGGNIVVATGNITGGNLVTGGQVVATGNVYTPRVLNGGTGLTIDAGYPGYIQFFNGNGSTVLIGDSGNINAVGNITSQNYVQGGVLQSTNSIGNEGGEINLAASANATISGVIIDSYNDIVRIFESGGTSRGMFVDLLNSPAGGAAIGYRDIPQVSFTGNTTIATTDAGKHYYSTQSSNYTLTIANNASQGFQVGAAITVVNQGTGNITVAQGSGVTLYLAGNASSGNRTVSTFGMATIVKVATDTWFISGAGVA
jgi:hypothetical protein